MSRDLFSPLHIRDVRLDNRIVASPMWQYAGEDGMPTDVHTVQLGRMAMGGAGLVFQEGTSVDRTARGTVGDLGIWDDHFIAPYARLVNLMKTNGAVPGIQLVHAGRKARRNLPWRAHEPSPPPSDGWRVVAPSPLVLTPDDAEVPEEMTGAEVADVVHSFVDAARRANTAGYEVLEVHAAHGYLVHTFLSPLTNHRTDRYGGSTQNRFRLLLEIVDGIRTVWPSGKALFVRLSAIDTEWGITDTIELVRELQKHGVDVIDCSSGGLTGKPVYGAAPPGYGYQVPYSEEVRRHTGVRTMAVGYIVHAAQAHSIVRDGRADLVALGRELLHNPNWPMDAARKLGLPDPYSIAAPHISYWLTKRARDFDGFEPSTDGNLEVEVSGSIESSGSDREARR